MYEDLGCFCDARVCAFLQHFSARRFHSRVRTVVLRSAIHSVEQVLVVLHVAAVTTPALNSLFSVASYPLYRLRFLYKTTHPTLPWQCPQAVRRRLDPGVGTH